MHVSSMCTLFLMILYMWYFSYVFKCFPFFSDFMMPVVSVMVPYVCLLFNIWFKYPELPLLFLISCICSLFLAWNIYHMWPMYVCRPKYVVKTG
jgi:hypothetical protein